jgi:hypothetical protein
MCFAFCFVDAYVLMRCAFRCDIDVFCVVFAVCDGPFSSALARSSPSLVQFPLFVAPIVITYRRLTMVNLNVPPLVFTLITLARLVSSLTHTHVHVYINITTHAATHTAHHINTIPTTTFTH